MTKPRVAFVYTAGRKERIGNGESPAEFFYGARELEARGYDVRLVQDVDLLGTDAKSTRDVFTSVGFKFLAVDPRRILTLAKRASIFSDRDVIVATTAGHAFELAYLRALGLVKASVIGVLMGDIPLVPTRLAMLRLRFLLRHVRGVVLSRGEHSHAQAVLGADRVGYMPFGVDTRFWRPIEAPSEAYALAIGNDANRDLQFLADLWPADACPLRIVTSLPIVARTTNVELVRGDWRARLLSDEAIRDLVQNSRFCIVPTRETTHPSGQSATLQAMACGRPTIVSATVGLWDRSALISGETCLLVPPGDRDAMIRSLRELDASAERRRTIGAGARSVVVERYDTEQTAAAVAELVEAAFLAGRVE